MTGFHVRSVRPYQLACLFCRAGAEEPCDVQQRVAALAEEIAQSPDLPLMLRCNVGDMFAFQDPGTADDTPEGCCDFNRKRDVDFLQWLDLAPGSILPARMLLKRLLMRVETVEGICGYAAQAEPDDPWRGCARAFGGDYERGREMGIEAIIAPRPKSEMEADKQRSMAFVEGAEVVAIRPHILLCAVCQYGGGTRPPYTEDNLPELLQMILQPDSKLKVKLVPGADWDMCAPCPYRSAEGNCVTGRISAGGLYNEVKDVNTLQALGLTYGTVIDAREVYRLIFERIPTADGVCALSRIDVPEHSVWRDGCHSMVFPGPYEKGREELRESFE
jgi:hypothetical protein